MGIYQGSGVHGSQFTAKPKTEKISNHEIHERLIFKGSRFMANKNQTDRLKEFR
jgi:hypothetical protein